MTNQKSDSSRAEESENPGEIFQKTTHTLLGNGLSWQWAQLNKVKELLLIECHLKLWSYRFSGVPLIVLNGFIGEKVN